MEQGEECTPTKTARPRKKQRLKESTRGSNTFRESEALFRLGCYRTGVLEYGTLSCAFCSRYKQSYGNKMWVRTDNVKKHMKLSHGKEWSAFRAWVKNMDPHPSVKEATAFLSRKSVGNYFQKGSKRCQMGPAMFS